MTAKQVIFEDTRQRRYPNHGEYYMFLGTHVVARQDDNDCNAWSGAPKDYAILNAVRNDFIQRPPLTAREREIILLTAQNSNKAIAYTLGISPNTVRSILYLAGIKLGIHDRKSMLAHVVTETFNGSTAS